MDGVHRFLIAILSADNLPPEVQSDLVVSVSTREILEQKGSLHSTSPATALPNGSAIWNESLLIETMQKWDEFVLTFDMKLKSDHHVHTPQERGRWWVDLRPSSVRLVESQETLFRLPLHQNYERNKTRSSLWQPTPQPNGEQEYGSDESDSQREEVDVYLRIAVKALNFSNFPTLSDESLDEAASEEEQLRNGVMLSSTEEAQQKDGAALRAKARKKEKMDEGAPHSNNIAQAPSTEEVAEAQEESAPDEQLLKKQVEMLQEGASFFLVTRKRGLRTSFVRLSTDQRTIICRRHTILLDSVDELREGQATDEFELHRKPEMEHLSFSLIYDLRKSFNLIAESEEQYHIWVSTLRSLLKKEVDEESAYAERAWRTLGSKAQLTIVEVLHLMRKLNMQPTVAYAEEMLRIVDANRDGLLEYNEFLQLLRLLRQRAELHELFAKYATQGEYLTPQQFRRFLLREQKEDISISKCIIIMKKFKGECKDINIDLDALLPSSSDFASADRRHKLLRFIRQIFLHFPSFVTHTARLLNSLYQRQVKRIDDGHSQQATSRVSHIETAPDAPTENEPDRRGRKRPRLSTVGSFKREDDTNIVKFWRDWAETKERREQLNKAELSKAKDIGAMITMNRWQFFQYMISDHNSPFIPEKRKLYQDMNRPLNDYYIASSHNTYLTGNQLKSKSATEMYVLALKQGCRCLELDCWDGKKGYPIVYHGHTLTSRVRFEDAVAAIAKYAFFASAYPLILSLEVHCSLPQQIIMANIMKKTFGEMLALPFANGEKNVLPSPEELKCKILLKGCPERLLPEETEQEEKPESRRTPKEKVAHELDSILYLKSMSLVDFQQFAKEECNRMASLAELRGFKILASAATELVALNKHKLTRIYPKGTRFNSTNYDPVPFWNAGCQLVALNYQHMGKKIFFNHGKFLENGQCGYVLKPPVLRYDQKRLFDPRHGNQLLTSNVAKLVVKVINARQLPYVAKVVNPYVVVEVSGLERDSRSFRTRVVKNNGFDPQWNQTFEFSLAASELAILLITIYNRRDRFTRDRLIAYYAMPAECIRAGYRVLHLFNETGKRIPMSNLLCHFSVKPPAWSSLNLSKLSSPLPRPPPPHMQHRESEK